MSLNALNVYILLNLFTMSKVYWRNKKYGGYKKRSESWQKKSKLFVSHIAKYKLIS